MEVLPEKMVGWLEEGFGHIKGRYGHGGLVGGRYMDLGGDRRMDLDGERYEVVESSMG